MGEGNKDRTNSLPESRDIWIPYELLDGIM
jgi:hypothetical protein